MTLNGVMAVTLRYFTEFGVNLRCRKRSVVEFMQESIVFLVCVQCRKGSSRSLSHLLMSFLLYLGRLEASRINEQIITRLGDHHWFERITFRLRVSTALHLAHYRDCLEHKGDMSSFHVHYCHSHQSLFLL